MRIALVTPDNDRLAWAAAADEAGFFGVAVLTGEGGVDAVRAAAVAVATCDTRLIVRVELGLEHPVTLAEEIAVLDNVSAGRVVALLDAGSLTAGAAREDVDLFRTSLEARPVQHRGARWTVPAGLNEQSTESIIVTPEPVQVEVPVWLTGSVAAQVGAELRLPALAEGRDARSALLRTGVQPALDRLSGDLDADRALVVAWADAGASHLLLRVDHTDDPGVLRDYVGRFLIPEVAMVQFPRILAEVSPPPIWPGVVR